MKLRGSFTEGKLMLVLERMRCMILPISFIALRLPFRQAVDRMRQVAYSTFFRNSYV